MTISQRHKIRTRTLLYNPDGIVTKRDMHCWYFSRTYSFWRSFPSIGSSWSLHFKWPKSDVEDVYQMMRPQCWIGHGPLCLGTKLEPKTKNIADIIATRLRQCNSQPNSVRRKHTNRRWQRAATTCDSYSDNLWIWAVPHHSQCRSLNTQYWLIKSIGESTTPSV